MNTEKYKQILIHHAMPSGNEIIGNSFIIQQDNDPKHTRLKVKSLLERKKHSGDVQVMK